MEYVISRGQGQRCIAIHSINCRPESALMMRTLRDMNMSKFVAEDVPLFLSLIQDLFPVQKTDRNSFPEVSAALEKAHPAPNP